MSCKPDCPESKLPESKTLTTNSVCVMPRNCNQPTFVNLLRHAGLTVNDGGSIESKEPLEGLRQEGDKYYLDWVPCTWKLLNIKLPKIYASCLLQLDVNQCASCPRRHISQ